MTVFYITLTLNSKTKTKKLINLIKKHPPTKHHKEHTFLLFFLLYTYVLHAYCMCTYSLLRLPNKLLGNIR